MLLEKKTDPGSYKWEPWGPPHPQPLLFSQSHSNLKAQGQLLSPTHLAGFLIIGRKEVTFWHPYLSEGATEPWAPHALLRGSGGGRAYWCRSLKTMRILFLPPSLVKHPAAPGDFSTCDHRPCVFPGLTGQS